jgi:hypothetical protein
MLFGLLPKSQARYPKMNFRKYSILFAAAFLLQACATISMVPHDVAEVDFNSVEGKTGWSEYQHIETFHDYNVDQVYEAAKVGLGNVGFSLREADKSKGTVIGEHGMTAHDWNIIAGVYFIQSGDAVKVKVIVEGSKDLGFSGDVTSDGWTGKILKEMRQYLNDTYQAILKIDKSDLK